MEAKSAETISDIINAIEKAKEKNGLEKIMDWVFRLSIGFLIWYSVQMVDKVDKNSAQMNIMSNQIELVKHDMEYIRRDVSKLETNLDKLTERK